MPDATFYLQKHGFSVLLQNPADMVALRNLMHGISTTPSATTTKAATSVDYFKNEKSGQSKDPDDIIGGGYNGGQKKYPII